jgi:hypothetical protein
VVVVVVVSNADIEQLLPPVVPPRDGVDQLVASEDLRDTRCKFDLRAVGELAPALCGGTS